MHNRELFAADALHTANDYVRSALILQHGDGVTDALRRVMGVPSLAEARASEAEMNAK